MSTSTPSAAAAPRALGAGGPRFPLLLAGAGAADTRPATRVALALAAERGAAPYVVRVHDVPALDVVSLGLPAYPAAGVPLDEAGAAGATSVVSVGGQQGTPEVAASALWRYLAESVWFPTALLPSERLTWAAVDDSTATATLTDRGARATAQFHFGAGGEIVHVTGERYRAVGDGQVLTPTEGRHAAYARVDGVMIPTAGEVAWLLPAGPHVYWRARVRRAAYTYAAGALP